MNFLKNLLTTSSDSIPSSQDNNSYSLSAGAENGSDTREDHLYFRNNPNIERLLQREGDSAPRPEEVWFSDYVVKINKKGKEQNRVMLITDKAIYNLLPSKDFQRSVKCKRRIDLQRIGSVTASQISDEFVLHVPEEYDYRYKSARKENIANFLMNLYRKRAGRRLKTTFITQSDLKVHTITKEMALLQTREEQLNRLKAMVIEENDSDHEDKDENKKPAQADIQQMLPNTQKVGLQDFDLLKVIGRGSFGKVMQVRKKDSGVIYAMKILKKNALFARNQVEHTRAERQILQALQHPFLMTLRYAFQTKEKLYFVLDYLTGGELFFHLKHKRRFAEAEARIYIAEIASALGHLHSLDVIYRDLKPENILLDDRGHVCLTDFGLSKDVRPGEEKTHTFCGTPEYLAPEVVMGCGHGKEVDWWSLGILLYELTVGIPPFYSQNVNEMYHKIRHGVLKFPPFLSDECKSLIVGLLNRDPGRRLGTGTEDVERIKAHPFFACIDWVRLYNREIEPTYKPNVKSDQDTGNFDEQFTSEPVVDSLVEKGKLTEACPNDAFSGFTYVQKDGYME